MRKLVVTLVVLVAVLVGIDFGARFLTQWGAGKALSQQADLHPAPKVSVHGFPFLLQVGKGTYKHVTVTATNVQVKSVAGVSSTADLYGLHAKISQVTGGDIDSVNADTATLTTRFPGASLARLTGRTGVTVTAGSPGTLRLRTTVAVAGQRVPLTVDVRPSISDNVLHLRGSRLVDAPDAVPTSLRTALLKQVAVDVPLSGLPFRITDAKVSVSGADLVVVATVQHLTVGQLTR